MNDLSLGQRRLGSAAGYVTEVSAACSVRVARIEVDKRSEQMNAKIREAQVQKVP